MKTIRTLLSVFILCLFSATAWSQINTDNTIWVDNQFGVDATALRERQDRPAKTLFKARSIALAGDTIVVRPGVTFNESVTLGQDINWHFLPGAKIVRTGLTNSPIFTDVAGTPVTCKITGHGFLKYQALDGVDCGVLRLKNATSVVDLQADYVGIGVSSGSAHQGGALNVTGGLLNLDLKTLEGTGARAIYHPGGTITGSVRELTSPTAANPNYLIEAIASATGTTKGRLAIQTVNAPFSTLPIVKTNNAPATSGTSDPLSNPDYEVKVQRAQLPQNNGAWLLEQDGGTVTFDADRVVGNGFLLHGSGLHAPGYSGRLNSRIGTLDGQWLRCVSDSFMDVQLNVHAGLAQRPSTLQEAVVRLSSGASGTVSFGIIGEFFVPVPANVTPPSSTPLVKLFGDFTANNPQTLKIQNGVVRVMQIAHNQRVYTAVELNGTNNPTWRSAVFHNMSVAGGLDNAYSFGATAAGGEATFQDVFADKPVNPALPLTQRVQAVLVDPDVR